MSLKEVTDKVMMDMGVLVHIAIVLLTTTTTIQSKPLNFILHQTHTECFYDVKLKNEPIDVDVFLAEESSKIDFAIFDPRDEIVEKRSDVSQVSIGTKANVTGPYQFCFTGQSLLSSSLVYFDFDPEISGRFFEFG